VHHDNASFFSFQQVGPKSGTPGVVASDAPAGSTGSAPAAAPGSSLMTFLPFLMLVPFLFLMFRRNKKEAELRSKLKKGDRVVSTSGLVGELMEMDERLAKVKIAPGTTVQMLASSLSPLDPVAAKASPDKDLKDLKDAKALDAKK
jgi:preprotein translocase subunit YajC